jgi:hypothetical protein
MVFLVRRVILRSVGSSEGDGDVRCFFADVCERSPFQWGGGGGGSCRFVWVGQFDGVRFGEFDREGVVAYNVVNGIQFLLVFFVL